jgi:hypothetical protein
MKSDDYKTRGANAHYPKTDLRSWLTHYPKPTPRRPVILTGIASAAIVVLWISLIILAVKAI